MSIYVLSIENWSTFSTLSSFVCFQNSVSHHLSGQCNFCLTEISFSYITSSVESFWNLMVMIRRSCMVVVVAAHDYNKAYNCLGTSNSPIVFISSAVDNLSRWPWSYRQWRQWTFTTALLKYTRKWIKNKAYLPSIGVHCLKYIYIV